MADQKLMDYIKQNIGKMGEAQVKKTLLSSGWPENQVNAAISEYSKSIKPAAGTPAKPAQAKQGGKKGLPIIPIAAIAAVVIAVVVVFVIFPDILSFVIPAAVCGNGVCEAGETFDNCPDDCPASTCGDGTCDPGETFDNCPADCDEIPPEPIKISVNVPASANVGDTVTASILASEAVDLFGFQFSLEYNSALLQYESTSEGAFLNNNGADSTFCVPVDTNTAGLIKNFACTRLNSGGSVTGVGGSGTLATATFTALSSGTSQITLTNVKFADTSAGSIPADVTSSSVIIS